MTPEVIAAFSMTAPREHIIERIRELEAAGLDEIAFSVPNDGARERIEELGQESRHIINESPPVSAPRDWEMDQNGKM